MLKVHPYLNFNGNAETAFKLYQSIIGGELTLQRFGDIPGGDQMPEEDRQKIMHAHLQLSGDFVLMASDNMESQGHAKAEGNNVFLSLHVSSKEEANRVFESLSDGGSVDMPMEDTFWGAYFGMFTDKFGIHWMVSYDYPKE